MLGTTNAIGVQASMNTLSISINGTNKISYDGKDSKSLDITLSSLGAAASNHTHSYLPLVGGTLTDAVETRRNNLSIYNNVAAFSHSTSSISGTIKITFPHAFSNTMLKIYVSVYNYKTDTQADIVVSAYPFAGSTSWYNLSAYCNNINLINTIRMGFDGNKCCLLLGTTSTVWSYPKIVVTKVIAGHSNYTLFRTEWGISIISSESGITMTNPIVINSGLSSAMISGYSINNLMTVQKDLNGFPCMAPGGTDNAWIRSTTNGILPFIPGTITDGHQYIGTQDWHFAHVFSTNFYGFRFYHNYIAGQISAVQASSPASGGMLWTY